MVGWGLAAIPGEKVLENILPETKDGRRIMPPEERETKKNAGESFGEMIKSFGEAMSEIFNDPELKEKAKEFGKTSARSAETFGNRLQDEEVKAKFREVGRAAQEFGKSVAEYFKEDKDK
jgi:[ribosomal protein S5]-alanine N-acetyltransferase